MPSLTPQFRDCLSVAVALAITAIAAIGTGPASAQADFPNRPIRVIVPLAPGGGSDYTARYIGQRLAERIGQAVVVDNRPAASGIVGTELVAKAVPDGYTLLLAYSTHAQSAQLFTTLPYDPIKDFAPVTEVIATPLGLIVHPSVPAKTVQELVAYAKANPNKLNFGTSGPGSIFHISGAWLHSITQTKAVFVHYKGAAPMHADLMAGTIQAGPAPVFVGLPYVKSGKLLPVAYMGSKRYKGTPDLKTVAEQGWPEFEYASWSGFLAPAKTPPAIIEAWHAAFSKVAKAPEVVAKMDADGAEMIANRPEEFRKIIVTELARYRKIVQENDIKAEQ